MEKAMLERIHQWFIQRRFKMMHFFVSMTVLYAVIVITVSVVPILYMKKMLGDVVPNGTKHTLDQIVNKSGDQLETVAATMMQEKARDVGNASVMGGPRSTLKRVFNDLVNFIF
jgi:hypothetical protein